MVLFTEEYITFILKEIGRNALDRINLSMDRDGWHTPVDMSQRTQVP
jgi:hypothetical protein